MKAANAAFQQRASRRRGQRPVPDLGQPSPEVRRDARGRQRAGRDRDGQHRDDEVHGRRRVPGPHLRQGVDPELGHLARGPRRVGTYGGKLYGVPYYAGSRVVTYRTDLFKKAGRRRCRRASPSSRRPRRSSAAQNTAQDLLAGLHRRHGLVRRDELRLRLRRLDRARRSSGKWKGTLDSPQAIAGLTAYKNFFTRRVAGEQDDRRDAAEPVRRLRAGPGRARSSAPAGSAAASATSTRATTGQFVMPSHTEGQADAGLPRRLRPRGPGRRRTRRSPSTGSRPSRATQSMTALRAIGNIPNTTSLLGDEHQRAGGPAQLVRPDGEELGQRGERQHPPQHARADPDRQAHRQAGRPVGQRQHHLGPQRART